MNEITKTAPNRKPRGFVERRLSFPNCGGKSFSSSFHYLVAAVAGSSIVDFCLKKERNCGYFCFLSKSNAVSGVNEINKIAPNRKQRGFVERSLSFLICGEKLFSSSFGNLVDAVAGSSIVDFCLKKERNCGYFCFLSKSNAVSGVNEINKIAPNRKQRGFVERSLSFLICGEKLFSSSFGNLVDAVAGSSDKNSIKL